MSKNTKKLLILNIYLVLGLLFTKLPEAWRYTNGADLGQKILGLGEGLSKAFAVPLPSFYPTDLLIWTCYRRLAPTGDLCQKR